MFLRCFHRLALMVADTRGELETAVSDIADDIREFNAEIMNEVSSLGGRQPVLWHRVTCRTWVKGVIRRYTYTYTCMLLLWLFIF